jgi:hypothetical protein
MSNRLIHFHQLNQSAKWVESPIRQSTVYDLFFANWIFSGAVRLLACRLGIRQAGIQSNPIHQPQENG